MKERKEGIRNNSRDGGDELKMKDGESSVIESEHKKLRRKRKEKSVGERLIDKGGKECLEGRKV